MKYELKNGLPEHFVYARSTVVGYKAEFKQEADGLANGRIELEDPNAAYRDYEYISAVDSTPVTLPVVLETECSFDAFGAPLIIFSEALNDTEDGFRYGRHYEAVLYEKGINIWQIEPKPEGGQQVTALCRALTPFPAGVNTTLTVRLTRGSIEAQAGELTAKAECSLPEQMYVGFTACEGINHFRSFSVERI